MKRYFNYDNYGGDYGSIRLLHRVLSSKGNRKIYNISNDVFFKGKKDYLCTKEKDFKILKDKSRYKKSKINNNNHIKENIKNKYFYKFNRYKYY